MMRETLAEVSRQGHAMRGRVSPYRRAYADDNVVIPDSLDVELLVPVFGVMTFSRCRDVDLVFVEVRPCPCPPGPCSNRLMMSRS